MLRSGMTVEVRNSQLLLGFLEKAALAFRNLQLMNFGYFAVSYEFFLEYKHLLLC